MTSIAAEVSTHKVVIEIMWEGNISRCDTSEPCLLEGLLRHLCVHSILCCDCVRPLTASV